MLASRLPLATGWGFFLSLATFWLLWITISLPLDIDERVIANPIQFTRLLTDSWPVTDPPRERPVLVPPETVGRADPIEVARPTPQRTRPDGRTRIEIGTPPGPVTSPGGSDHDAIPWVRIQPQYPPAAERRGIEGWVRVQFSVTASGEVADVFVVDADPPGVFDRETIEAVRRWRYRPKVEDGVPVARVGLQTLLHFTLD